MTTGVAQKARTKKLFCTEITNYNGDVIFSIAYDTYVDHRTRTTHRIADIEGNPVNVTLIKNIIQFSVKLDDDSYIPKTRRRKSEPSPELE